MPAEPEETVVTASFSFEGSRLVYHQWGHGPAVMLCFHGIGQTGLAFEPLGVALSATFTVYSFDLFYHGQSSGLPPAGNQGEEHLSPRYWQALTEAFMAAKNISRFSVSGFSMGGVFALATALAFAERIDGLWLLAPDGIAANPWYRLATGSAAGRGAFRFFLNHLDLLRKLSEALVRLGWLDRSLVRFAQSTLASPEQRDRVYRSWVGFRPLRPSLDALIKVLNAQPVGVRMYLGAFDRILPRGAVQPLLQQLNAYDLVVLKVGHNRLLEAVAARLTHLPT